MTQHSVRFDDWLQKLADNPVWWFLLIAGLNNDRKERVVAAPTNGGYQLDEVRRVCCRPLAEVHVAERHSDRDSHRGRPNGKGLGASSHSAPGHRRRHVRKVAVVEEPAVEPWEPNETCGGCRRHLRHRPGRAGRPRCGQRDSLNDDNADRLDDATLTLNGVTEALETVREIRGRVGWRGGGATRGGPTVVPRGRRDDAPSGKGRQEGRWPRPIHQCGEEGAVRVTRLRRSWPVGR